MTTWKRLGTEQIKQRVFEALSKNVNYTESNILGVPASHLDSKVFNQDAPFLKEAPFISTLTHNPNHIGCHTLGSSESFFNGTQEIERETIEICAQHILKAAPKAIDGYVASGGTEANMQAIWIYRNYFMQAHQAKLEEICILTSSDAHYSMSKASNILCVEKVGIPVVESTRKVDENALKTTISDLQNRGKKYFIVVVNMMTTMFGSVDEVALYTDALDAAKATYQVHVDGAYGGFYYPFSKQENDLNFSNSKITSVTLDAHKMAQAPYGTGIFLIRKNWMQYATTNDASYVEGEDSTLIGSRSGANAIAIWMILMANGPYGWFEKVFILQKRTEWFCDHLQKAKIEYYRHLDANIITIKAAYVPRHIAEEYGLVPDNHHAPKWFKIVVMEHVTIEKLMGLLEALRAVQLV